jgi:hypothetical protein
MHATKTLVVVALLGMATVARAHPLDTLGPGQWLEVPSSHLQDQFPTPPPAGNTGPSAVIAAWGGGAYDSVRGRLLLWGGGHNDYGGNEVYAFDVAALKWSRIWGPDPVVSAIPDACASSYPGGTPSARHTYGGLVFIPTTGRLWASGGFRFCGNTSSDGATWLFDPGALTWRRGADALEGVGTPTAAWDPGGKRVLYQAQNVFQAYDPITDQYTKIGQVDGGFWATAVSAVDVARGLFLSVTNGKLRVWNLATGTFTSDQPTTGGVRALAGQPGVEWDPTLNRVVSWPGGTSVYSLDVAHWTWFEHAAAASNTVTPTPPATAGTFGRFRYLPDRNAYVLVNKTSENVFFYKLTAGDGTPVPPAADAGLAFDASVPTDGLAQDGVPSGTDAPMVEAALPADDARAGQEPVHSMDAGAVEAGAGSSGCRCDVRGRGQTGALPVALAWLALCWCAARKTRTLVRRRVPLNQGFGLPPRR